MRTDDMALLIIEHKVGDYETFERVFMDDQERRRRQGCRGARVHRRADDPNDVWVVLEFDTAEHAREHAEGLELHEAIKWATSNVSMPTFVVLEKSLETDA
jgi:Antibiotic biosynthesis monooxygenase